MAAHSSILACEIPWTEELGGLQSMSGSQRVGHNCVTNTFHFTDVCIHHIGTNFPVTTQSEPQ